MIDWIHRSHRLRIGRVCLTFWPDSFPWLLTVGRRQRWLYDRGQGLADDQKTTEGDKNAE